MIFFNYPRLGIPKSRGVKSFYIWGGVLFEKHGILKLRAVRPITFFWLEGGGLLGVWWCKFDIKVEMDSDSNSISSKIRYFSKDFEHIIDQFLVI